jgi:hypothetical protein
MDVMGFPPFGGCLIDETQKTRQPERQSGDEGDYDHHGDFGAKKRQACPTNPLD